MEKSLPAAPDDLQNFTTPRIQIFVYVLFFLSGAVSLVLQVAWVKHLSLFFGSDARSAAITLGVFMGGLALGSWASSRLSERTRRPLFMYGVCEVFIAVSAYAVPVILDALQEPYRSVYLASFTGSESAAYLFKTVTAVAVLLVPTTLMGATLPLVVRAFARTIHNIGFQAGRFYAFNTFGAFAGVLAAGFIMLPYFGTASTVDAAVAVGLLVGIASILIDRYWVVEGQRPQKDDEAPREVSAESRHSIVLLIIALSGAGALALEVIWMRVLVQSFSGTVYAFSIMLASFLFGIYFGSFLVSKSVDKHKSPFEMLILLQLGLGMSVAALAIAIYAVPTVFSILVWGGTTLSGGAFGPVSIAAQFIVAAILILVPTILLGATFPYAVRAYAGRVRGQALGTGRVLAANTAGSVVGSLAGGFIILPLVGTRGGLIVVALVFILNALILAASNFKRPTMRSWQNPAYISMLTLTVFSMAAAMMLPRQTVANYGLQRSSAPELIYHGDGVSNSVDIVKNDEGNTIMMINGNVEADTTYLQRRHFVLKAHVPLLLHPDPKDVAIVGLGLGVTLASTTHAPSVERIRLVELSPEMVRAHEYLRELTGDVLDNPKIDLRIDDGRNFLAMTDETFDVVTADPVHPRISGVGYLYTREYYETIKSRLRPGGVVAQWMPMYNISPESFDAAFRTFAQVFPNASFWYVRGHGLFVAGDSPVKFGCSRVQSGFDVPAVATDLASIDVRSPEELAGFLLMDGAHIAQYLERNDSDQIVTDDNAYLEYKTPFEFMGRTDAIIPNLLAHAGWSDEVFEEDCSAEFKTAARERFLNRISKIPAELAEPIR